MVEYAVLLGHTASATVGTWARSAELWLSSVNWELVGVVCLGLIGLRIATWAFRAR
jgi:hypothetical protein